MFINLEKLVNKKGRVREVSRSELVSASSLCSGIYAPPRMVRARQDGLGGSVFLMFLHVSFVTCGYI